MATEVHEEYNGYKCPKHFVIKKTAEYEERRYESSQWVSTKADCEMYGRSSFSIFQRLLGYISGGNEQSVKIPMTVPVLSKVDGPVVEAKTDHYEMSFFLGQENESFNAPSKEDVYLQTLPPQTVYCIRYGGYNSAGASKDHLKKLLDALDRDGLGDKYHSDVYFSAGYDSPWKFFGRRNEVWLVKKEEVN